MTGLAILEKVVKVISVGLAVVEVVSECKKILDQTKSQKCGVSCCGVRKWGEKLKTESKGRASGESFLWMPDFVKLLTTKYYCDNMFIYHEKYFNS